MNLQLANAQRAFIQNQKQSGHNATAMDGDGSNGAEVATAACRETHDN